MTVAEIINKCNQIHNGTFFKIHWRTNCAKSLNAQAKRSGVVVTKDVHALCRKGIHYSKIASVINKKENMGEYTIDPTTHEKRYTFSTQQRAWSEEVIPNLLIKHKTTGKHYLVLYPTTTKPKVQYYVNEEAVTPNELREREVLINSYFTRQHQPVILVPIQDIIDIG